MSPEQIEVELMAFEASLKTMPEWAPEFEPHRAWVEQYAFFVWLARAEKAQRVRSHLQLAVDILSRIPAISGTAQVEAMRSALKD